MNYSNTDSARDVQEEGQKHCYKTLPGSFILSHTSTRRSRRSSEARQRQEPFFFSFLNYIRNGFQDTTPFFAIPPQNMKMTPVESSKVLKEGELEKRSDNLLQLWKRKTCVLTTDSLNLYADTQKKSKSKEIKLECIKKVDCVERTGKFVYFTIVTTDDKEIDFRCSGEDSCWNAVITMALIDFQNRRAIQDFKTRQDAESSTSAQQECLRMARAP